VAAEAPLPILRPRAFMGTTYPSDQSMFHP
jgi:hypothetical protein